MVIFIQKTDVSDLVELFVNILANEIWASSTDCYFTEIFRRQQQDVGIITKT